MPFNAPPKIVKRAYHDLIALFIVLHYIYLRTLVSAYFIIHIYELDKTSTSLRYYSLKTSTMMFLLNSFKYLNYLSEMITDHIAAMHSEDLVKEIQPAVETSLAMVLEDVANKFLKHVPSEMVFPN